MTTSRTLWCLHCETRHAEPRETMHAHIVECTECGMTRILHHKTDPSRNGEVTVPGRT